MCITKNHVSINLWTWIHEQSETQLMTQKKGSDLGLQPHQVCFESEVLDHPSVASPTCGELTIWMTRGTVRTESQKMMKDVVPQRNPCGVLDGFQYSWMPACPTHLIWYWLWTSSMYAHHTRMHHIQQFPVVAPKALQSQVQRMLVLHQPEASERLRNRELQCVIQICLEQEPANWIHGAMKVHWSHQGNYKRLFPHELRMILQKQSCVTILSRLGWIWDDLGCLQVVEAAVYRLSGCVKSHKSS